MNATLTLPWWSLLALLALGWLLGRWLGRLFALWRAGDVAPLLAARLDAGRRYCEQRQLLLARQASRQLDRYFRHLAKLRLKLGLLDYEQLVQGRLLQAQELCLQAQSLLANLEKELQVSAIELPEPPQWLAAVEAMAALPPEQQRAAIVDILAGVLNEARSQHAEVMREYRWAAAVRLRALAAAHPDYRRLRARVDKLLALLRSLDRHSIALNTAAAHYAALREASVRRSPGRPLRQFVLSALLLATGLVLLLWNAALLYTVLLDSGVSALQGRALAGSYTAILLLLGAVLCSGFRWSEMLPAVAGMAPRPRRLVLLGSLLLLMAISAGSMHGIASQVSSLLAAQRWPLLPAWVFAALVYLLPPLMALLVLPLEQLLRSGRPLATVAAQRCMGRLAQLLGGLSQLLTVSK